MTNQHPITPPPELVEEWVAMLEYHPDEKVFSVAAQWGADAELDACCWWLNKEINTGWCLDPQLRTARRPKPPSLKEQALDELASAERLYPADWSTIRKALEALPNE